MKFLAILWYIYVYWEVILISTPNEITNISLHYRSNTEFDEKLKNRMMSNLSV